MAYAWIMADFFNRSSASAAPFSSRWRTCKRNHEKAEDSNPKYKADELKENNLQFFEKVYKSTEQNKKRKKKKK